MDSNMKREIILDNYENPRNRGLIDNNEYEKYDMNNESCIDHVIVEAKIEDLDDAKKIVDNFEKMINGEEFDKDILEEASVYEDIKNQPNRKKCACLSWWGIDNIINKK